MTIGQVPALTLDAWLRSGAAPALSGTVHSAFRSVINIAGGDGHLWCVTSRDVPPGPRAVALDVADFTDWDVAPGAGVTVRDDDVDLAGRYHLTLSTARPWHQPPVTGPVIPERCDAFEELLHRRGAHGSIAPGTDAIARLVAQRLDAGIAALAAAVRGADAAAITRAARLLVGLGPGLTPSGDDLLVGFAYSATCLGGILAIAPAAIAPAVTPQATNDISRTALHDACAGRAGAPLVAVLKAITVGGVEDAGVGSDLDRAVTDLLAIGHTSGTDQAYGLLAAARLSLGTPVRGTAS